VRDLNLNEELEYGKDLNGINGTKVRISGKCSD
jgi:hypothetical protein